MIPKDLVSRERSRLLRHLVTSAERDLPPALRAQLVAHGLRSEEQAIEGILRLDRWKFREGLVALAPVLSLKALQSLLARDLSKRDVSWPVQVIAEQLVAAGQAAEAVQWLTGKRGARLDLRASRALMDALPEEARQMLRAALDALPPTHADADESTELGIAHAMCLEPRARHAMLEAVNRRVMAIPRESLYADSYSGDRDPRLLVAENWIELGQLALSQAWLERVAADPAPWSTSAPATVDRDFAGLLARWCNIAPFTRPIQGAERKSTLGPNIAAAIQVLLDAEWGAELLAIVSPVLTEAELATRFQPLMDDPSPQPRLWCRVAVHVEGWCRPATDRWVADVCALLAQNPTSESDYSAWYALSQHVVPDLEQMGPLLAVEQAMAVLTPLDSWMRIHKPPGVVPTIAPGALGSWEVTSLFQLARPHSTLAKETLRRWSDDAAVSTWAVTDWASWLDTSTREAVLHREMADRATVADPKLWRRRLIELAGICTDAEQREALLALATQLSATLPPEDFWLVCTLPSPDQGARVQTLLDMLAEAVERGRTRDVHSADATVQIEHTDVKRTWKQSQALDRRNHVLRELLPHLEGELARTVTLAMCHVPFGCRLGSSPWWLEHVAENLGEAEWTEILRELIDRDAIDPAALWRPSLPPVIRAEMRAHTRPDETDWQQWAYWLSWNAEDMATEEAEGELTVLTSRLRQAIDGKDPETAAAAWTAYTALLRSVLPIEAILELASHPGCETAKDFASWAIFRLTQEGHLDAAEALLPAPDTLAGLRVALCRKPDVDGLTRLVETHGMNVLCYPWVQEILPGLGLVETLAEVASARGGEDVLRFGEAYDSHMGGEERARLLPTAWAAARDLCVHHRWLLPYLDDAQVQTLWQVDSAMDNPPFDLDYLKRFGDVFVRDVAQIAVETLRPYLDRIEVRDRQS